MRRLSPLEQVPVYQVAELRVDLARHQVTLMGKEVLLTPTEFDLLKVLIQNAGKVITHRQLIHNVWGVSYEDESRLLRVNISNLRRKIEPNPNQPQYILTELGVGYRLKDA
jgi:two-component system, OmpR family, KDP operon response regulator KdpE